MAFGLVAQAADTVPEAGPINKRVVAYCKKYMGKRVGNGECADLAFQALIASGAESPDDFKDDPKPGDYVWGSLVYGHRIEAGDHLEKGDRGGVRPGDIVQMRDVIIEHEEVGDDYVSKETIDADHHTAVVSKVSEDGMTYEVIEQNSNEIPVVTAGQLHLEDMKRGYILVYRPIPDER